MNLLFTAALAITCNYAIEQAPFVTVSFNDNNGQLDPQALINSFGQTHRESLTAVEAAPEEMIHAWISKENPQNAIELIIYKTAQPDGRSKMINPQMPDPGKVIWGDCPGLDQRQQPLK